MFRNISMHICARNQININYVIHFQDSVQNQPLVVKGSSPWTDDLALCQVLIIAVRAHQF